MTEKLLPYDRSIVPQETGWWCGPAATQVVLNSRGIILAERDIAHAVEQIENPGRGDDRDGTDYVGLLERYLDGRVPDAKYTSVYIENDPPTTAQKETLWRNIVASIDAGWGVIMNWVAPPSNKPRGVNDSVSPSYSGGTTYHYVAAMGYKDDVPGVGRALWIADSGFRPFGYWISFDQAATLIPPKGYTYAAAAPSTAPPPPPKPAPVYTFDSNVKTILRVGQSMGVTPRGLKIGLATALVESNIKVYANPKVPESMLLPHQAVGNDGYSVGIWQQQVVWGNGAWWWGDAKTCMDPESSSRLFFDRLLKLDYNNTSRSPGSFAQAVQKSAYPNRYDERFAEAERLYDQYVNQVAPAAPLDPIEELLMSNQPRPSRSHYRKDNKAVLTPIDALYQTNAMRHEEMVEAAALRGEGWAIRDLAFLASGEAPGAKDADGPFWVARANHLLAVINAVNPQAITAATPQKGATP
ncbi:C39 family peptidase [Mycolicibacterium pulveris]|uniref:Peptidase C39-like domain-containing protein n=1 Tax=Mycolicibacterium pulveris TaxID=36813 RepID=A0A7I7UCA6_MYCPV|nr:C39 family peptidase [Mycolicibacterium pulveris]MCV6982075.1 C39 family peptidase [Mycolicibacterium pulveris]BBY78885.1 hypothetical protein MPUL_00430 [Mycolicibacterium pulveris]